MLNRYCSTPAVTSVIHTCTDSAALGGLNGDVRNFIVPADSPWIAVVYCWYFILLFTFIVRCQSQFICFVELFNLCFPSHEGALIVIWMFMQFETNIKLEHGFEMHVSLFCVLLVATVKRSSEKCQLQKGKLVIRMWAVFQFLEMSIVWPLCSSDIREENNFKLSTSQTHCTIFLVKKCQHTTNLFSLKTSKYENSSKISRCHV